MIMRRVCARVFKLSRTSAPSLAELLASVSPLAFVFRSKAMTVALARFALALEAYERSSAAAAD
jgi:hypothetical protein